MKKRSDEWAEFDEVINQNVIGAEAGEYLAHLVLVQMWDHCWSVQRSAPKELHNYIKWRLDNPIKQPTDAKMKREILLWRIAWLMPLLIKQGNTYEDAVKMLSRALHKAPSTIRNSYPEARMKFPVAHEFAAKYYCPNYRLNF